MAKLWPETAYTDPSGQLWLGGCAVSELTQEYGTPLYVFDEATLRGRARAYQAALRRHYPGTSQTAYAAKAYLCLAIAQLFEQEGLDLDVVSGGELSVALRAGFPAGRIHFHGNNKSRAELAQALGAGIGRIVVDNFHELAMLRDLADPPRVRPKIWLRLSPGVQAHTHAHIQTGHLDSKFGFAIETGDAQRAVEAALSIPGLELVGLHAHIGSQIYEPEALAAAAVRLIEFAAAMRDRHGFELAELSPGGGWGVPMVQSDPDAELEPYIAALSQAIVAACREHALALPHLVLEPGRSLVAPAAVALYTVGARKEIPGVRTYVSVDGGMADNIRPALYGARYSGLGIPRVALRQPQSPIPNPQREVVTIAGKFCESGDILIRDIELPRLEPGDLLAIPMAGAYTLAMASNYNLAPRPAVVMVGDGRSHLIQRRESYADLAGRDLALPGAPRLGTGNRRFWKYHALGNDYIVLDPADWPEPPSADLVRRICDRHRGVGSDGVLWGPTAHASTRQEPGVPAFALRLFNPDGGEFEKSGNGLRIFARYLWDRGYASSPDFAIRTPGGDVTAHILEPTGARIAMDMGRVSFESADIPTSGPSRQVVEELVSVAGLSLRITAVGIGNPHCVVFVDGANAAALGASGVSEELARGIGPLLEQLPLFPRRTNVQFAQALEPHTLRVEVWERGAGYTLASGTSACAAAAAGIRTGRCRSPVTVQMPGGEMLVEVAQDGSARLTGTVEPVCSGELTPA